MGKTAPKKIRVLKDGPYLVAGDVPLSREIMVVGADKEPESWKKTEDFPAQSQYAPCRCGASKNKPFCDGSHLKTRFNDGDPSVRKP